MEIKSLYQLKSEFVARVVGNELILVPLTGNLAQMSEMFTLNETAKFIWENLTKDITIDKLVNLMTSEFEIDSEIAKRDIEQILERIEIILKKN